MSKKSTLEIVIEQDIKKYGQPCPKCDQYKKFCRCESYERKKRLNKI